MPESVLTGAQRELLKKRAAETQFWRDEEDLERRRRIGKELQETIQHSGILSGQTIDYKTLCELIDLQWQIQNLNPIQMPKLLGLYAYKLHFGGFRGTESDLHAQRKEETGDEDYYPGADLLVVTEALRLMASNAEDDQGKGASRLLDLPGAGQAIVSGFLHLLHPDNYGLVNAPTKSPFDKGGWLEVDESQRRKAREIARDEFPNVSELSSQVFQLVFRWQIFLKEVKEACDFEDFHEVDQFLWTLGTETVKSLDSRLRAIVNEMLDADVQVRKQAESEANKLIQENLGHLSGEQLSAVLTDINTCVGKKGVVYTRCAPAFVGYNANQLIEQVPKLNPWIERLWTASQEELAGLLNEFWAERIPSSGRSFPSAILYLRDGNKYAIWTENLDKALCSFLGGVPAKIPSGFSYFQYCKRVQHLRKLVPFPPEMHDWVLFRLIAEQPQPPGTATDGAFTGFQSDAFQFMQELATNNNQQWFDQNWQRFRESVDAPLRALVKDLGEQFITPLDPKLETSPKSNKCISRIRKNVYGKQTEDVFHRSYWAAFYRKELTKQTDAQLFVGIHPSDLTFGLHLGEQANDVQEQLADALKQFPIAGKAVLSRLKKAGFVFVIEEDEQISDPVNIDGYDSFVELANSHHFSVYRRMNPEDAVAAGKGLREQIGEDFQTLYPLFILATSGTPEKDVLKLLQQEPTNGDETDITISDLAAATFMEESFFQMLDRYLLDKKQLVFCGPPGTGKTFVALRYADYLTQDGGEVTTVQFHPSYGYEDFIEGIRPVMGKGGLTYQVEDGIFKRVCDEARANSKSRHVLLIDEINRGNIPRIFGELLFLLERREQKTTLPYSKEPFSIPRNVIILGTMNSSDRSIALMDLALRRRFHFVPMQPRSDVLLGWLKANGKPIQVQKLFERLNDSLRNLGIERDRLVGHAHFMSPQINEDFLELIWAGTIEPLLNEYFFAEPEKLAEFAFEKYKVYLEEKELEEAIVLDEAEELRDSGDLEPGGEGQ